MLLIAIPWYVIFIGLAAIVGVSAYLVYRLSLRNARARRASSSRARPRWGSVSSPDDAVEAGPSHTTAVDDYVILGGAGLDLADPHNANDLYDNPAGRLQD